MLQTRHRADKENQVHRPPKTPGAGKSIIAKTPFHDENNVVRTVKKSVVFGQPDRHDVFQTPGKSCLPCRRHIDGSAASDSGREGFEYATDSVSVSEADAGAAGWRCVVSAVYQAYASENVA